MTAETEQARFVECETTAGERFRIKVEPGWQLTYGQITPGAKLTGGYALRLYGPRKTALAIFTDVKSFRDVSIETLHEAHRRKGKDTKEWFDPSDRYGPMKDYKGEIEVGWVPRDQIISSGRGGDEKDENVPFAISGGSRFLTGR